MDGHVVGAAWLLVAQRVPTNESLDRWYGDIQSVKVREEYRNRGIPLDITCGDATETA